MWLRNDVSDNVKMLFYFSNANTHFKRLIMDMAILYEMHDKAHGIATRVRSKTRFSPIILTI